MISEGRRVAISTERRDFPAPVAPKMTTILSLRFWGRDWSFVRTEKGKWECEEKDGDVDVVVKWSEIFGRRLSSVIKHGKRQKQKPVCFFSCTGFVSVSFFSCKRCTTLQPLSLSLLFSISRRDSLQWRWSKSNASLLLFFFSAFWVWRGLSNKSTKLC